MPQGAEVQNQKNVSKTSSQSQVTEVSQGNDMRLGIGTGGNPGHETAETGGDQDQVTGVLE
jgi:hypothetical protein